MLQLLFVIFSILSLSSKILVICSLSLSPLIHSAKIYNACVIVDDMMLGGFLAAFKTKFPVIFIYCIWITDYLAIESGQILAVICHDVAVIALITQWDVLLSSSKLLHLFIGCPLSVAGLPVCWPCRVIRSIKWTENPWQKSHLSKEDFFGLWNWMISNVEKNFCGLGVLESVALTANKELLFWKVQWQKE